MRPWEVACLLAIWVGIVAAMRWRTAHPLRQMVEYLVSSRQFATARELGDLNHLTTADDPHVRYYLALAAALNRDKPRAIAELEALRHDKPRVVMAWLSLAGLYLDDNQPERALEVAQEVTGRLQQDASAYVMAVRAGRRLGDLNRARLAADLALTIEPGSGIAKAAAAAIALDQGDIPKARQLIKDALNQAPDETYVQVVNAEIALKTLSAVDARQAVAEALAAIESNPLAMLNVEREILKQANGRVSTSDPTGNSTGD